MEKCLTKQHSDANKNTSLKTGNKITCLGKLIKSVKCLLKDNSIYIAKTRQIMKLNHQLSLF